MTSSYARQFNPPSFSGLKTRSEVMSTVAAVAFLPSLGMVWRGMWSLAYVPPQIDEAEEVAPSTPEPTN